MIKGALETAGIVAVVLYTVFAYEQWQETIDAVNFSARQTELSRKGLKEAVKNFRVEQRARVGAPMFNIGPPGVEIGPNVKIVGNVELENFGKLPGVFDTGGIIIEVRSSPVPENFHYPVRPKSTAVIYPGQKGLKSNDYPYTVTSADFQEIKTGKAKRLILHGFVGYHDDFGSYVTQYCFYWVGEDRFFSPCQEHNKSE